MPVLAAGFGAHQRQDEVGAVDVGRPDLGPVQQPAALHALRLGADGGEIGADIGLAHADAGEAFAPCDGGEVFFPCGLAAEGEDLLAGLPVRDPVGETGGAGGQHLLLHHEPLEFGAFAAAVSAALVSPTARSSASCPTVQHPAATVSLIIICVMGTRTRRR